MKLLEKMYLLVLLSLYISVSAFSADCTEEPSLNILGKTPSLSLTKLTVPTTVEVGEDVELVCHYKMEEKESPLFYVKWWWTPLDAGLYQKRLIYQRLGHGQPQFLRPVTKVKDNDTLQLVNLQANYSGNYECEVFNDLHEDRRGIDLFVYTLGSGPQLSVTPATDGAGGNTVYRVTCEATGVAPEPRLTIHYTTAQMAQQSNHQQSIIEPRSREALITNMSMTGPVGGLYNITAHLTLDDAGSGTTLECLLYFANSKVARKTSRMAGNYVEKMVKK